MIAWMWIGCGPSLDGVVQDAVDAGFRGVIHVERGGETLELDAWGDAIEEEAVPNTVETVFDVGSLTKQFTAALVLEARDRGLLALDDTLAEHFEDVPADRAHATLHELLTHTAGMPDSLGVDEEPIDRDAYIARAWETALVSEPGSSFSYSNTGYSLLAAIVERRSGLAYEVALREWLLLPLGIEHTGYREPDWTDRTLAIGYRRDEAAPPVGPSEEPHWHLVGNGGILSTPEDMRRWVQALAEGDVLTRQSREELWAHHVRTWPRAWYGYGWGVEDWMLMGFNVNHDGGNGFYYAHVVWWPDQDTYIALLSNRSDPDTSDLGWRLSRAVLR